MEKNTKIENAKIKMRYFEYLLEGKGLSSKTIGIKERVIADFEKVMKKNAFKNFSTDTAIMYKNLMLQKESPLKLQTISYRLDTLKYFFKWLRLQPGYKNINLADIDFFNISRGDRNAINTSRNLIKTPKMEYVLKLIDSIPGNSDLGKRDRALIIFLLLSGIRVESVTQIPLRALDRQNRVVTLNPLAGTNTKFKKAFDVTILPFNEQLITEFDAYVEFLVKTKNFQMDHPLFPATKIIVREGTNSFEANTLSSDYWKTTNSVREIIKRRCENAGLEYFSPHSYRRLHVQIAQNYCNSIEDYMAISMNLGHESLQTTYISYGTLNEIKKKEILSNMNFSKTKQNQSSEMSEIKERLTNIEKAVMKKEDN